MCNSSFVEYVIEITNSWNQTDVRTHNYQSREITIDYLKSFTNYTIAIYAVNELGPSPKSKSLKIQTIESGTKVSHIHTKSDRDNCLF